MPTFNVNLADGLVSYPVEASSQEEATQLFNDYYASNQSNVDKVISEARQQAASSSLFSGDESKAVTPSGLSLRVGEGASQDLRKNKEDLSPRYFEGLNEIDETITRLGSPSAGGGEARALFDQAKAERARIVSVMEKAGLSDAQGNPLSKAEKQASRTSLLENKNKRREEMGGNIAHKNLKAFYGVPEEERDTVGILRNSIQAGIDTGLKPGDAGVYQAMLNAESARNTNGKLIGRGKGWMSHARVFTGAPSDMSDSEVERAADAKLKNALAIVGDRYSRIKPEEKVAQYAVNDPSMRALLGVESLSPKRLVELSRTDPSVQNYIKNSDDELADKARDIERSSEESGQKKSSIISAELITE